MQNNVHKNNSIIRIPVLRKIKKRSNDGFLYKLYFKKFGFSAWINDKDFTGDERMAFIPIDQTPEIFVLNGFIVKEIGHFSLKEPIEEHYYLVPKKTLKKKQIYLLKPLPIQNPRLKEGKSMKDILIANGNFLDWKTKATKKSPLKICEKVKMVLEVVNNETLLKDTNKLISEKKAKIEHKPKDTTRILKKFKYDNDSGFKELVHTPKKNNFTINDYDSIIQKAEKTFKKLNNVPYELYKSIEQLIKLMKEEGRKCFEKTGEYPLYNKKCDKVKNADDKYKKLHFGNVNTITGLIQSFKRNYRFDNEKSEASVLRDLIINVTNKLSFTREDESIIEFDPKLEKVENENSVLLKIDFNEKFDSNAVFFSWVPNIRNFLKDALESILKHGNVNGDTNYQSYEKEVLFEVNRVNDPITFETKIHFIIYDKGSVVKKGKEDFYKKIKERKENLVGLCDWKIEADFEQDESYEIAILPETNKPFNKLNKKVGGLKHILTFYE